MIKGEITKRQLISKIEEAIYSQEIGAFIGAGLSVPAGFLTWNSLLKKPAEEIFLDISKEENDLLNLAQYYCNCKNRVAIDDLIKENFSKIVPPTINHELLAQLPISTYWTTNYDKLIEKALENFGKLPYVKTKDDQLRGTNKNFDAIIYKIHGDVDDPGDAVITRSDYEEFGFETRRLFREVLEGELLTKTFLFLGFSFSDSNFNYILGRLRVLLTKKGIRNHYCIMKKVSNKDEDYEYKKIKQELQIEDLNRYNIFTYLIDDYSEITEILQILVNRFRRKTIFISGSAENYGPLDDREGKHFVYKLSYELAKNGYKIVNGYGLGIGTFVINGVADYCYKNNKRINEILTLMPFPMEPSFENSLTDLFDKNRKQMLQKCGIALYLFGNKKYESIANGVISEYKLSKTLGIVSLPIQFTGGAANKIYKLIEKEEKDEDIERAIEWCSKDYNNNLSNEVENILKAIKILNKEEC